MQAAQMFAEAEQALNHKQFDKAHAKHAQACQQIVPLRLTSKKEHVPVGYAVCT